MCAQLHGTTNKRSKNTQISNNKYELMRGNNNQRMLQSDQNNNLQRVVIFNRKFSPATILQQGVKTYQNKIPLEIHRATFPMAALVFLVTPITYAGVASHAKVDVIKIPKMWMR